MKQWAWTSAFIFGLVCAANGGLAGLVAGGILGYLIGALLYAFFAFLTVTVRLALWAGILVIVAVALAR